MKRPPDDTSAVLLASAYDDLSQEAFAIWVRLMVATPADLTGGRQALAKVLRLSEGTANRHLRELADKGYLRVLPSVERGHPTRLELAKRAMLTGPSSFVTLSAVLHDRRALEVNAPKRFQTKNDKNEVFVDSRRSKMIDRDVSQASANPRKSFVGNRVKIITENSVTLARSIDAHPSTFVASNEENRVFDQENVSAQGTSCESGEVLSDSAPVTREVLEPKRFQTATKTDKKQATEKPLPDGNKQRLSVLPNGGLTLEVEDDPPIKNDPPVKKRRTSTSEPRAVLSLEREDPSFSQERSHYPARGSDLAKTPNASSTAVDMTALDGGRPIQGVTFEPDEAERAVLEDILSKPAQNKARQVLVSKVGQEFMRLYLRYRRQFEPKLMTLADPRQIKYAEQVGVACLTRGITPKELLSYWHSRIGNFTGMTFPPLHFLAGRTAVEEVSATKTAAAPGAGKRTGGTSGRSQQQAVDASHLGNTDRMHPELRSGLMEAGFDLSEWPDRHLMSVQSAAIAISRNMASFVPESLRDKAEWAATNLYGWKGRK